MKRKHHKKRAKAIEPSLFEDGIAESNAKRKRPHGRKRASAHLWRKATGNIPKGDMREDAATGERYRADSLPVIPSERMIRFERK